MTNLPEAVGMIVVAVVLVAHVKFLRKTARRAASGALSWRELARADMETPPAFRIVLGTLVLVPGLFALVAAVAPWVRPGIHPLEHLEVALAATAVFSVLGAAFTYVAICALRNRPFFPRRAA